MRWLRPSDTSCDAGILLFHLWLVAGEYRIGRKRSRVESSPLQKFLQEIFPDIGHALITQLRLERCIRGSGRQRWKGSPSLFQVKETLGVGTNMWEKATLRRAKSKLKLNAARKEKCKQQVVAKGALQSLLLACFGPRHSPVVHLETGV